MKKIGQIVQVGIIFELTVTSIKMAMSDSNITQNNRLFILVLTS